MRMRSGSGMEKIRIRDLGLTFRIRNTAGHSQLSCQRTQVETVSRQIHGNPVVQTLAILNSYHRIQIENRLISQIHGDHVEQALVILNNLASVLG